MTNDQNKEFAKKWGNKFRIAREKAGFTQEDIAAKAGINITTYARIERGEITTKGDKLIKLAGILKVNL